MANSKPVDIGHTLCQSDGLRRNDAPQNKQETGKRYACYKCGQRHLIIELWTCKECDLRLICSTCAMESHRNHDVSSLKDVIKKQEIEFDARRKEIFSKADSSTRVLSMLYDIKCEGRYLRDFLIEPFGTTAEHIIETVDPGIWFADEEIEDISVEIPDLVASGQLETRVNHMFDLAEICIEKENDLKNGLHSVSEILCDAKKQIQQIFLGLCKRHGLDGINLGDDSNEESDSSVAQDAQGEILTDEEDN